MNIFWKHAIILLFSAAMLSAVVLVVPMPAEDNAALRSVRFGWPFPFLTQDFSDFGDALLEFSRFVRLDPARPIEAFSLRDFFFSWGAFFAASEGAIRLLEWAKDTLASRARRFRRA